jgi:hypothetical protein
MEAAVQKSTKRTVRLSTEKAFSRRAVTSGIRRKKEDNRKKREGLTWNNGGTKRISERRMCIALWIRVMSASQPAAVEGTKDSLHWAGAESDDSGKGEEQTVRMVRPKNAISTEGQG